MLRRIVIGYDFSETADDALAWTLDLAKATGAHVSVVHVSQATGEHDPEVTRRRADLAAATQDLDDVSTHVLLGDAVAARLVAFADETDADAIVVAMTGASSMRRWMLGSVADDVLHTSHCPVIAYRAEEG